jgi:hypothetical protein
MTFMIAAHSPVAVMLVVGLTEAMWAIQVVIAVSAFAELLPNTQRARGLGIAASTNATAQGLGAVPPDSSQNGSVQLPPSPLLALPASSSRLYPSACRTTHPGELSRVAGTRWCKRDPTDLSRVRRAPEVGGRSAPAGRLSRITRV